MAHMSYPLWNGIYCWLPGTGRPLAAPIPVRMLCLCGCLLLDFLMAWPSSKVTMFSDGRRWARQRWSALWDKKRGGACCLRGRFVCCLTVLGMCFELDLD